MNTIIENQASHQHHSQNRKASHGRDKGLGLGARVLLTPDPRPLLNAAPGVDWFFLGVLEAVPSFQRAVFAGCASRVARSYFFCP